MKYAFVLALILAASAADAAPCPNGQCQVPSPQNPPAVQPGGFWVRGPVRRFLLKSATPIRVYVQPQGAR